MYSRFVEISALLSSSVNSRLHFTHRKREPPVTPSGNDVKTRQQQLQYNLELLYDYMIPPLTGGPPYDEVEGGGAYTITLSSISDVKRSRHLAQ